MATASMRSRGFILETIAERGCRERRDHQDTKARSRHEAIAVEPQRHGDTETSHIAGLKRKDAKGAKTSHTKSSHGETAGNAEQRR